MRRAIFLIHHEISQDLRTRLDINAKNSGLIFKKKLLPCGEDWSNQGDQTTTLKYLIAVIVPS